MQSKVDNWSLKGKVKYYDIQKTDIVIEEKYDKDDIETLRQKLIEDLEELNDKTHDREYNWLYDVKRIINKRFGVE